jgi:hypothetical protein
VPVATLHRNCHSPSLGLTVKLSIVRTIFENGCLNLSPQKKNQWKIEQGKRFNILATIRRASSFVSNLATDLRPGSS